MAFFGLFGRKRFERAGFELYNAAVRAAREPYYYTVCQVPDTMDGRFDMVGLHVFLVIHRLRDAGERGKALGQAVFDAMFSDMDFTLRELGVGDMNVGKRVKAMWEAFHGRSSVYATALLAHDPAVLAEAIERNVWRGQAPAGQAQAIAAIILQQDRHLAEQPVESLEAGRVTFLPAMVPA